MKHVLLLLILSLSLTNSVLAETHSIQSALQYWQTGQHDKAIEAFEFVLIKDPKNIKVLHALGSIYLEKNSLPEAKRRFKKITEIDPKAALGYYELAMAWKKEKKFDEAIPLFEKAWKLDPKDPRIPFHLGLSFTRTRNYKKAKKAFEAAIKLDPDNPNTVINLGLVYEASGFLNKAIKYYEKVTLLDNENDKGFYYYGIALAKMGRLGEALQAFQRTLELDPKNASVCFNIGSVLGKMKKYKQALAYFKKALDYNPLLADAHYNLGILYHKYTQDLKEASYHYRKYLTLQPKGTLAKEVKENLDRLNLILAMREDKEVVEKGLADKEVTVTPIAKKKIEKPVVTSAPPVKKVEKKSKTASDVKLKQAKAKWEKEKRLLFQSKEADKDNWKQERDLLTNEVGQLEREKELLRVENLQTREITKELIHEKGQLKKEIVQLNNKISGIAVEQKALEKLKNKVKQVQRENKILRKDNLKVEGKRVALEKEKAQLKIEVKELQVKAKSRKPLFSGERAKLLDMISRTSQENDQLRQENDQLHNEVVLMKDKLNASEKYAIVLDKAINDMSQQIGGKTSVKNKIKSVHLPKTYRVKKGDTLWIIAAYEQIYSRGDQWKRIYNANKDRIKDPKMLAPGQELVIPR